MAMFRMDRGYGISPMSTEGLVSFTDSGLTGTTANRQVLNAVLTVTGTAANTGPNAAFLGADNTVKPPRGSQKFTVFANPNGSVAGATGNANTLPLGLATGGTTNNSEYVLDFSGFNGDITGASASIINYTRNSTPSLDAVVSAIDNVNKLVYVNTVTFTSGAPAPNNTTNTIVVDVQFCDEQVAA